MAQPTKKEIRKERYCFSAQTSEGGKNESKLSEKEFTTLIHSAM